jgi:O-antigen ligase
MNGAGKRPYGAGPEAIGWALRLPASARPSSDALWVLLTAVWTAAGIVLYVVAPMTAPAVLGLAVVAPFAWCWAAEGRLPWTKPTAVFLVVALASAYVLVNGTWSPSPAAAAATAALLLAAIAIVHITTTALAHAPTRGLRAMGIGLLAGVAIAGLFLCLELLSDQWMRRTLAAYHTAFWAGDRHMHVETGQVSYFEPYLLNRSVAALALTFWPALLVLERLTLGPWQRNLLIGGLCLTPLAIVASEHGTSKMAFAGAAAVYGIGRISPRWARRVVIAGWIAATMLVVPLAGLAYGAQAHLVPWFEYSVRHRIVIWKHAADEIAKAPVLGAGLGTPRALHQSGHEGVARASGTNIPLSTPLHSHNAYLQVWYETGAVGAAFLLLLGLLVLRAIGAMPARLQHHFWAIFAACALLAASSFSIWAAWLMSALALTPIFASLGAALYARAEGEPT